MINKKTITTAAGIILVIVLSVFFFIGPDSEEIKDDYNEINTDYQSEVEQDDTTSQTGVDPNTDNDEIPEIAPDPSVDDKGGGQP